MAGNHLELVTEGWCLVGGAEMLFGALGSTRADAAFRALSRVLHPDANTGDAELMRTFLAARSKRRTAS